jgi:hypothetical protein
MVLGREKGEKDPPGLENDRVLCPNKGRLTMQHPSTSECTLDIHADRLSLQRSCKTRRPHHQNSNDSYHSAHNSSNFDHPSGTSRKSRCKKWQFHRKINSIDKNYSENINAQCADKGGGENMSSKLASKTQCVPLTVSSSSHSINVSSNNPSALLYHNYDRPSGTSTSTNSSQKSFKKPSKSYLSSPYFYHFLVLVLLTFAQAADCCSSRSTPKPRPPSHSGAMRPNITFQTYACPPAYAAWYCLNGATCFTVKIADSILYNCE